MNPVAIEIGPIAIRWYGLLIIAGAIFAAWIAGKEARRRHENPDHIWTAFIWVLIGGIIGARLQFILTAPLENPLAWQQFLTNPMSIFATWEGGVGIFGGFVGGGLALFLYTRRHQLAFLHWADIAIVGVPFGQAIGRLGNYINQELYGGPTNQPWGIAIDCEHRVAPFLCPPEGDFTEEARFHPAFLYELLWNLLIGAALVILARRYGGRWPNGRLTGIYFFTYASGRFFIEFFRLGAPFAFGLTAGQVFSLCAVVASIFLMIRAQNQQVENN